jgi:hypothetical protein
MVVTAKAGGTGNNQLKLKSAVEDTVVGATATETAIAMEKMMLTATSKALVPSMAHQHSDKDDASGMCLTAKDYTVAWAFPLLLPLPLPLPLCQNSGGSSNNSNDDGSSGSGGGRGGIGGSGGSGGSGGDNEDNGGLSGCVSGCVPLLFC